MKEVSAVRIIFELLVIKNCCQHKRIFRRSVATGKTPAALSKNIDHKTIFDHAMAPMMGGGLGVNGGPIPGAANGAPGIMRGGGANLAGIPGAGPLPHGDLHGEDVRVFYNIENPSIDLETYVQGNFTLTGHLYC